jgi:DNA-binding IscR family transcriptional regulator
VSQHAGAPRLGARLELELALTIMLLVGRAFWRNEKPWTEEALAQHMHVPVEALNLILSILIQKGILIETNENKHCLLPGRDLDALHVRELMRLVALGERSFPTQSDYAPPFRLVRDVLSRLDDALEKTLGNLTLKDLVRQLENDDKVKVMSSPKFN